MIKEKWNEIVGGAYPPYLDLHYERFDKDLCIFSEYDLIYDENDISSKNLLLFLSWLTFLSQCWKIRFYLQLMI